MLEQNQILLDKAVSINPQNSNFLTEWTQEVKTLPNVYGFFNQSGMFRDQGVSTRNFAFDKVDFGVSLLNSHFANTAAPQGVNDPQRKLFQHTADKISTVASIFPEDLQGHRMHGTPNSPETLASVKADKLLQLKSSMDYTHEYMRCKAIQGKTVNASGEVVFDSYTANGLNEADYTYELSLNDYSADIGTEIREIKRRVNNGIETGLASGRRVNFVLDDEMFDKLISHPSIKELYTYYMNSGKQQYREDIASYYDWGINDFFEHAGITFMQYNPKFARAADSLGGITYESMFETGSGIAVPQSVSGMFAGFFAPAGNRFDNINTMGEALYAYEWVSPKNDRYELEMISCPLFLNTRPKATIQLKTKA